MKKLFLYSFVLSACVLLLSATLVHAVGMVGGGAADHGTNPSEARIWFFRQLDRFAIPL